MYLPSTAPLPWNSQTPNTASLQRGQARAARLVALMERGRTSNLQRQMDHTQGCGPGRSVVDAPSPLVSAPSNWLTAMQSLFGGILQPRAPSAPIRPTMPQTLGAAPAKPVPPPATPERRSTASNPAWTPAEKQAILDAPEMIPLEVAKVTCSSAADEPPVNTYPRSAPPWGNAVVARAAGTNAAVGFSVGPWVCDHPWWSLVIAGVAGIALKSASER